MLHLSVNDPATIAFVVQCLQQGAIDAKNVREWAEEVLLAEEDCPIYVESLTVFDGPADGICKFLGFTPVRNFTPEENAAIAAIASVRKSSEEGAGTAEASSIGPLGACPQIVDEFRRTFPLLSLPGVETGPVRGELHRRP